jgi:DnaJ-class molecular chaperone
MTEKNEFGDAFKQIFNDPRLGAKFLNLVADAKEFGSAVSERLKSPEVQEQLKKMKSSFGFNEPPTDPNACLGCNGKGWITIGEGASVKAVTCPICNGTGKKCTPPV